MDDILSDTGADDSDGTTVFVLQPPRVSSSFERRLADTYRHGTTLKEDSPPGVYFKDGKLVLIHFPDLSDTDHLTDQDLAPSESGSDTAVDTSSSESSTEEDSEVENSPLNRSPSLQKNKSLLRATTPPRSHAHVGSSWRPHDGTYLGLSSNVEFVKRTNQEPDCYEYYFVNLVTTQFDSHYSNNKEEELFRLEVDTGSDVTWVLTSGVYKLPPDSKKTADTITTPVHLRAYDADELGAHSVMVNVGIDLDCPPPVTEANIERLCDGVVKYADLSRVMIKLVKCAPERRWKFMDSMEWGSKVYQRPLDLTDRFRMGACCAATKELVVEQFYDGLLGLGPSWYQGLEGITGRGDAETTAPSVLSRLARKLKHHRDSRGGHGGVAMYFIIPPLVLSNTSPAERKQWVPGVLAFQKWPFTHKPPFAWSKPIPIGLSRARWDVPLIRMRILHFTSPSDGSDSPNSFSTQELINNCTVLLDFDLSGKLYAVDTGTSVSYFPTDVVKTLSATFTPQSGTTTAAAQATEEVKPSYKVPVDSEFRRPRNHLFVVFDFSSEIRLNADGTPAKGNGGMAPAEGHGTPAEGHGTPAEGHGTPTEGHRAAPSYTFPCPAANFLYNGVGEGLLWPSATHTILGLNFFHVMLVCLHRARQGNPFVQFAPFDFPSATKLADEINTGLLRSS